MPDETYRIIYEGVPDKAARAIDALVARLGKLEVAVDRLNGKLKAFGTSTPGLMQMEAAVKLLEAALKGLAGDANRAEKELKDVGKGNRSVAALTARLKLLEAELKAVAASAATAGAATAGVGAGAGGGGKGVPGKGAGRGSSGVVGMAAAASVGTLFEAIHEVSRGAQKGRDYFRESAGLVESLRNESREYTSLRSNSGLSQDQLLREMTGFGKDTGMLPDELVPFLATYEGSATTGRLKGNIGGKVGEGGYTQAQQEALEAKLKRTAAKFALRTGLDPRTAGDVAGVASTYARINSPEDLAGQLGGMHYGLDQGRGEITPLARGELGQAGSSIESGRVSGLPELGAFIGVASVASKSAGSAGTTYGQVSRFLNESGEGNDKQKAFIKESGIGAARGDFAKLKALRDHLARVKPEDANTYLESVGYGNSTDRRSVLGMVGNVDVLEERIRKAKEIAADGAASMARDEASQNSLGVIGRKQKAESFAVDVEAGLKQEKLEIGQQAAMNRLKDPNQPGGPRINTAATSLVDFGRKLASLGFVNPEEERVAMEAVEGLVRGGKAVKLDIPRLFPGLMKSGLARDANTDAERREQYGQAFDLIQSRGGDPFGGAPQKAARKLEEAAGILRGMGGQGPPPFPPPGNGGAGALPARR